MALVRLTTRTGAEILINSTQLRIVETSGADTRRIHLDPGMSPVDVVETFDTILAKTNITQP
ncbi:hypothetical protein IG197_27370 [Aminobacter sp. SR38]|jgi:hypothetical protein|uniref:hypothetical protein n=1 Tax=Aminobacter sp. SR38 TaxID=2774562 RepID=UPI001784B047|nr:hypothetical protein [Aminobacter sp. SR38]QOF71423.1 hypothetical protein IG197_27370 [Aminobacter sp. SR38]